MIRRISRNLYDHGIGWVPGFRVWVAATGMLPGSCLLAAEQAAQPARPEALVSAESTVQMLIALVVVVAIIIGLSILIRRFRLVPGSANGVIRVVGSLALNSKDRLLLIQVGEEQILISASPGRIGKLHGLDKPVETAHAGVASKGENRSFNNLLDQVLNRSR